MHRLLKFLRYLAKRFIVFCFSFLTSTFGVYFMIGLTGAKLSVDVIISCIVAITIGGVLASDFVDHVFFGSIRVVRGPLEQTVWVPGEEGRS
jgi:hypothetical protein